MCRAIPHTPPPREYWWAARVAEPLRSSTLAGPGVDPGNDRHAGTQPVEEAVRVVDRNFNGNSLNHLGEISGRIVGRQERELRAGARRKREHMAVQPVTRERIHGDLRRLADGHVRQLGFLVVRDHPDVRQRNERGDLPSDPHVLTRFDLTLTDHAVLRGENARVTEVDVGELETGPLRGYGRLGLGLLGSEGGEVAGNPS